MAESRKVMLLVLSAVPIALILKEAHAVVASARVESCIGAPFDTISISVDEKDVETALAKLRALPWVVAADKSAVIGAF